MHRIVWLKRALSEAHDALGSTSCTELAQISILCIMGMIASMLVIASSDRTFAAVYGLCTRIMACNERDRFRVTPASRLFCRSRSARAKALVDFRSSIPATACVLGAGAIANPRSLATEQGAPPMPTRAVEEESPSFQSATTGRPYKRGSRTN
jgi:hypothetical protein